MKKELRVKVWKKYDCHCAYCGEELEYKKMQVDHIIPKLMFDSHIMSNFQIPDFLNHLTIDDLNHFDNLNPACRQCNFYKSAQSLEMYRNHLKTMHERILKPFIVRLGVKMGMVNVNEFDGEFYFEKNLQMHKSRKNN